MDDNMPRINNFFDESPEDDVNLLEIIRLTNLFPEASYFAFLANFFPELYKDSKKMLAFKNAGNAYELLDEKDVTGVVETDIIPIEYHSSYSLGLAAIFKSLFEEYSDFFKLFLKKYDKLVIDSEEKSSDSILVINDYVKENRLLFFYNLRDFLEIIFNEYGFNEEEIYGISRFIDLDSESRTNYLSRSLVSEIENNFDLLCLICNRNDLDLLYKFATDRSTFDEIKDYYFKKACYEELNNKVDIFARSFPFIDKHIDLVGPAIAHNAREATENFKRVLVNIATKKSNCSDEISDLIYDKNDVINLTRNILDRLDSTGKLSSCFEVALAKDDIILWNENEKELVRANLVNLFSSLKEKDLSDASCFRNEKGRKISICLKNIVSDTLSLVHEFIHYYIKKDTCYTSEIATVYFETKAGDLLIESGFSETQVKKDFDYRYSNDGLNNTFSGLKKIVTLLCIKKKYGYINSENIRDIDAIEATKECDDLMENIINMMIEASGTKDLSASDIITRQELDNDKFVLSLLNSMSFYILDQEKLISYSLGSFLGRNRCEELDQIMFNYINHSENITEDEFYDSLSQCMKKKNQVASRYFQYVKTMSDKNKPSSESASTCS